MTDYTPETPSPAFLRLLRNGDNEHDAEIDACADTWGRERTEIADALRNEPNTVEGFDGDGMEHSKIATASERIANIILERDGARSWEKTYKTRIEALEHDLVLMRTDRDAAEYHVEALSEQLVAVIVDYVCGGKPPVGEPLRGWYLAALAGKE